jgi:hypothetical protein
LEIGSFFLPRTAWTLIFLSYFSHWHWDDKVPPHPAFFPLRWVLSNCFWPGLALNFNPLHFSLPSS